MTTNAASVAALAMAPAAGDPTCGGLFARPEIEAESRPDGSLVLRSRRALGPRPRSTGLWLEHWGSTDPGRPFLAERLADGRLRQITYGEALAATHAIGQSLIERRLAPSRPILILAENGIDHALLMLGALHAGIPVAPVSTAYARLSRDYSKLAHISSLIDPELVYLDDAARYAQALHAMSLRRAEIVASRGEIPGQRVTPFAALAALRPPGPGLARAFAAVGPDTIAKILFTSGSTGSPKGVINTQRMLVSAQESLAAIWPFVANDPPRLVDWLPWNHTFGGNHNFNLVLRNGGFMLIDEGRPLPGLIERTLANLKEVSPSIHFNVPRGWSLLLDHLERDAALQMSFFDQLRLIMFAGAALPTALWSRLEKVTAAALGRPLPMTTSWGSTETAPLATSAHFPLASPANIGVPVPGTSVRLVPSAGRLEIRVKGPNITPGYFKEPALSAKAFDVDGWLITGDAARFVDPADPGAGLVFDGRLAENFKLLSGTWVNVGLLRTAAITAAAPLIEDCVVTGHDGDEIGLLAFPSLEGLRALVPGAGPDTAVADLVAAKGVAQAVRERLRRFNAGSGGSSERIARVLFLTEPPSIDAGEITDKGYINQRAVVSRRADLVARLHAAKPDTDVILVG